MTTSDLLTLAPGRYEIMGEDCYATIEDYLTKPRNGKRWECHRNHIDIQCVATGRELVGCADLAAMTGVEYDPAKDLEFLEGPDGGFVGLEAGSFAIVYPEDAHMPGICVDEPEPVRKIVVKVLV